MLIILKHIKPREGWVYIIWTSYGKFELLYLKHLELRIIQVYDRDSQPKSVNDVFLYMYGLVWTHFIDKMV